MEPRERELVTCLELAHEVGGADEGEPGGLERIARCVLPVPIGPAMNVVGALDVRAGRELCELWPLDAPERVPVDCSLMSGKRAWRSRRAALSRRASTSASSLHEELLGPTRRAWPGAPAHSRRIVGSLSSRQCASSTAARAALFTSPPPRAGGRRRPPTTS